MNRPFRTYTIYRPRKCEICGITENTPYKDNGFPRLLEHHILYLEVDGIEIKQLICYNCHKTVHGLNSDGDKYDQMAKFNDLKEQKLRREVTYVKT